MSDHIGFLVHDVARQMRRVFDKRMAGIGLTRSQWWVLAYLQLTDGATQNDLAVLLDVSPASLGACLRRLEAKGRIRRVQDPNDRRANRVYICDPDGSLTPSLREAGRALMEEVVQDLAVREREDLVRMLRLLKSRLTVLETASTPSGSAPLESEAADPDALTPAVATGSRLPGAASRGAA